MSLFHTYASKKSKRKQQLLFLSGDEAGVIEGQFLSLNHRQRWNHKTTPYAYSGDVCVLLQSILLHPGRISMLFILLQCFGMNHAGRVGGSVF